MLHEGDAVGRGVGCTGPRGFGHGRGLNKEKLGRGASLPGWRSADSSCCTRPALPSDTARNQLQSQTGRYLRHASLASQVSAFQELGQTALSSDSVVRLVRQESVLGMSAGPDKGAGQGGLCSEQIVHHRGAAGPPEAVMPVCQAVPCSCSTWSSFFSASWTRFVTPSLATAKRAVARSGCCRAGLATAVFAVVKDGVTKRVRDDEKKLNHVMQERGKSAGVAGCCAVPVHLSRRHGQQPVGQTGPDP